MCDKHALSLLILSFPFSSEISYKMCLFLVLFCHFHYIPCFCRSHGVHFHCSCFTWLLSFHFIMFVSCISKCSVGDFFFFCKLTVNSTGKKNSLCLWNLCVITLCSLAISASGVSWKLNPYTLLNVHFNLQCMAF